MSKVQKIQNVDELIDTFIKEVTETENKYNMSEEQKAQYRCFKLYKALKSETNNKEN